MNAGLQCTISEAVLEAAGQAASFAKLWKVNGMRTNALAGEKSAITDAGFPRDPCQTDGFQAGAADKADVPRLQSDP